MISEEVMVNTTQVEQYRSILYYNEILFEIIFLFNPNYEFHNTMTNTFSKVITLLKPVNIASDLVALSVLL